VSLATSALTLGAAFLGSKPGADALADALVASTLGPIDTANIYGGGVSETLLGEAISRSGGLAPQSQIYSKADRDAATGVFDGDRVRRSLDESLSRLGLDRLPLYQLHDPYSVSFEEALAPGGAVSALLALRDEGVIGAMGIAAGRTALVLDYVNTGLFDAVLSHNRFTLVDQAAEPIFEAARARGMTVFNAAPFGGGVLAQPGATTPTYGYNQVMSAEFSQHIARVHDLARDYEVDVAAAALHFSLRSPLVDSTVVGISTVQRLDELAVLAAASVPEEFMLAVEALGPPPPSPND